MRRLRVKLSLTNLAATLAAFLALGAGYAAAFSGSGTLQKGSLKNIPATDTQVRTVTGIGEILARCAPNDLRITLLNTSGETLRAELVTGSQLIRQAINDDAEFEVSPAADTHFRYHVYPADGDKRPQADISLTVFDDAENCATSVVTALVLNTEE